eukprot:symbB.v1.2.037447.t1/scaffold5534.1/size26050/4
MNWDEVGPYVLDSLSAKFFALGLAVIRENAAPAATPTTTETPAAEVKTEEPAVQNVSSGKEEKPIEQKVDETPMEQKADAPAEAAPAEGVYSTMKSQKQGLADLQSFGVRWCDIFDSSDDEEVDEIRHVSSAGSAAQSASSERKASFSEAAGSSTDSQKELASFRRLRALHWEVMKTLQTRRWMRSDM